LQKLNKSQDVNVIFSKHAEEQLSRRSLERNVVEAIVLKPDQIVEDENDDAVSIYQAIVKDDDIVFLYRVFVNTKVEPNVIVTVYKTTKIEKYYES